MSIEAMKQALEALEKIDGAMPFPVGRSAITSLRQAIAEAKNQEPVAWMDSDWHYQLHKKGMVVIHKDEGDVLIGKPQPIYTTPQQRTWAGLTDEEIQEIALELPMDAVRITEAKLKEKNT